jgi:flagellar biosynthesis/type III secretory pathway protein FliH
MANVIKGDSSQVDSFQPDTLENIDMEGTGGKGYVDPAALLAEARQEAEIKVQEAYAEGLRRGIAKGEEEFRENIGQSMEVLQQVASALQESRELYIQEMEKHLLTFVQKVAGKVIQQEVSGHHDIVLSTVRALLSKLFDQETVSLFVNPNDLALLVENKEDLLEQFSSIKQLEIHPDEEVQSGGCFAKTNSLVIDGSLEAQLNEIIEQLRQFESEE